jgi:hypothetical protein
MSASFHLKSLDLFSVHRLACLVILDFLVAVHLSRSSLHLRLAFLNRCMNDQEIFIFLGAADVRSIPFCPVLLYVTKVV